MEQFKDRFIGSISQQQLYFCLNS